MPARILTSRFCNAVKPVEGKQVAYPDAEAKGLELRVSATRKVWCFRYRTLAGRQQRLQLGVFNDEAFGVDLARRRARALRVIVDEGGDPAAAKRDQKTEAQVRTLHTFDDLADEYLAACARGEWRPKGRPQRASSQANNVNALRLYVRPVIGKMKLEAITEATVRGVLRGMIDEKIGAQTNKAHGAIRQAFAFAIKSEKRLAENPAAFAPMVTERTRERVLSEAELRSLWPALVDPAAIVKPARKAVEGKGPTPKVYLGRPVSIALQLAALLLQRRSEIAGMRTAELDLDAGLWVIPAERAKGGRTHVVPLPPRAVELIREALKLRPEPAERPDGKPGEQPCVFPSPRSALKPILGGALTHGLVAARQAVGLEGVTVHDLRRTGATMLTGERLGVRRFIVAKILAHADREGPAITAVYDRNEYLPDKRRALEAWEGLLLELVGEKTPASNIAHLARSSKGSP